MNREQADKEADARLRVNLGTKGFQRDNGGWADCECGQLFTSTWGHKVHRKGSVCATPEQMIERGYSLNPKGQWRSDTPFYLTTEAQGPRREEG